MQKRRNSWLNAARYLVPLSCLLLLAALLLGTGDAFARYRRVSEKDLGFTAAAPASLTFAGADSWRLEGNRAENLVTLRNPGADPVEFTVRTFIGEGIGDKDKVSLKLTVKGDQDDEYVTYDAEGESIPDGSLDADSFPGGWRFRYLDSGEEPVFRLESGREMILLVSVEKGTEELPALSLIRTVICPRQIPES